MADDTKLELASSWSLRAHYSADLELQGRLHAEREGHALCDPKQRVYDEAAINRQGRGEEIVIADLPTCKRCARKALQLGITAPGPAASA